MPSNNERDIVAIVIILLSVFGVFCSIVSMIRKKNKKLPKLAGTTVPQVGEGLDISKRYDIVYSGGDYSSQFVERLEGIKIIGYVGRDDDESVGKMYLRSRWLVVEFSDGRKAYLMPHAIMSLQESRAI